MANLDLQFSNTINLDFRYRNFLNLRGRRDTEIRIGDLTQQGLVRNRFSIEKHLVASRGAHFFDLRNEDIKLLLSEYVPAIENLSRGTHLLALFDPIGNCAFPFSGDEISQINESLSPITEMTEREVLNDRKFTAKVAECVDIFESAVVFVMNWVRTQALTSPEFANTMVRLRILTRVTVANEIDLRPVTPDQARNLSFDQVYSLGIQAGRMPDEVKNFFDKLLFYFAVQANEASRMSFVRMTDTGSKIEQQIRADNRARQVKIPTFFRETVERKQDKSHFFIRLFVLDGVTEGKLATIANFNPHQSIQNLKTEDLKNKYPTLIKEGKITVGKDFLPFFDTPAGYEEYFEGLTTDEVKAELAKQKSAYSNYEKAHTLKAEKYIAEESRGRDPEIRREISERERSAIREQTNITIVSKIEQSMRTPFDFDSLLMLLKANEISIESISLENVNLDFLTANHIYYTSRNQIDEPDQDIKHLFAFQRALQFVHNFHYDSNEFTVTNRGFINIVDTQTFERLQQSYSEPTLHYVDFIIGVLSFLKSGHHATTANILNMATKIYTSLGYNLQAETIRQRVRASLYHGSHVGSTRMHYLYIHLRHQKQPLSNSIILRLNTNPPLSMPYLNLALYIEGLAKVQFFRYFGEQLKLNLIEFRDNIDLIQKLKHFAAPYANYFYGKTVTIPANVVEQLNRFAPLARALSFLLPNSSLNMSASLQKLIRQASSIDVGSDITVQAYITTYRANIRTVTAASMGQQNLAIDQ